MASTKTFIEGRQPWYDDTGARKQPLLIGVCGASASGKTALCKEIIRGLKLQWAMVIGMESFYRDLTEEEQKNVAAHNFDEPDAFDWKEMIECLKDIKEGKPTTLKAYDWKNQKRSAVQHMAYGVDVILFEGILAYFNPEVAAMMDIKLFVDSDDDSRLARRLRRDTKERGKTVDQVLKRYESHVKPGFAKYIAPLKKSADLVVPRGAENAVAVRVIVQQVQKMLSDRGWAPVVRPLSPDVTSMPNIHVLPDCPRIRALQTILRNRDTPKEEYVYHSDRLVSVLVEHALSTFPHKEISVETPTGSMYPGEDFIAKPCGVSIMRGGCSMEAPLRAICKGIRIGKILIKSDEARCPKLIYVKLPHQIAERHVLLLDASLVSGATLIMAVHVLQDHGVDPSNISFLTLTATSSGLHEVARMFPDMKIVAAVVESLDYTDKGMTAPGLTSHSDRYFG